MNLITTSEIEDYKKVDIDILSVQKAWLLGSKINEAILNKKYKFSIFNSNNYLFDFILNSATKSLNNKLKESGWYLKKSKLITLLTLGIISKYYIIRYDTKTN